MQFIRAAIFMYWGSVQLLRFLFICSSVLPWQFDFVCKSVYAYCHEDSFSCLKISFFQEDVPFQMPYLLIRQLCYCARILGVQTRPLMTVI